ncbi:MAG: DUF1080 domain-containing protein [Candidatus Hydrogenedentes bacterium]|nr:DUF1080 domain-containing protein [Candidatus Hydrogenedentota bacterium]
MSVKKIVIWVVVLLAVFSIGFYLGLNFFGFLDRNILKKPVPIGELTPAPTGEGWIDLLSPDRRKHWKNATDDSDIFEITDEGVLHIYGKSLYPLRYVAYTAESFSDFQLHLEFRLTPRANSGVFVRSQLNDPVNRGFEIQVLEDYGKPPNKNSCGAIYDITTPMYNMSFPAGQWNSYDITVKDSEVIVYMNGWMVIHTFLDKMTTPLGKFPIPYSQLSKDGYIMLQDHGGEVWYRNIRVKKL